MAAWPTKYWPIPPSAVTLQTVMLRPFHSLRGSALAASDGEIGKIREFYFDDELWIVRYLIVEAGSCLSSREVLIVPLVLGAIDPRSGAIAVTLTREQVLHAPLIETDRPISQQEEARLHQHYDWDPHRLPRGVPGLMLVPSALAPAPAFAPAPEVSEILQPDLPPDSRGAKGHRHLRSSAEVLSGYTINAQDAEIGIVNDFIVDDVEWRVRYLEIHTGILFFGKDKLLAPEWVERISHETAEVFVNLVSAAIKDAPEYNSAEPLSQVFEQRLHDHYSRKG
jgi:hypothetical protein